MCLMIAGYMPHLAEQYPSPKPIGAGARVNNYNKQDLYEVSPVDRKALKRVPRKKKRAIRD